LIINLCLFAAGNARRVRWVRVITEPPRPRLTAKPQPKRLALPAMGEATV